MPKTNSLRKGSLYTKICTLKHVSESDCPVSLCRQFLHSVVALSALRHLLFPEVVVSFIEEHGGKSRRDSQANKAKLERVAKDEARAVLTAVKVGSHGLNLVSDCIFSVARLWD